MERRREAHRRRVVVRRRRLVVRRGRGGLLGFGGGPLAEERRDGGLRPRQAARIEGEEEAVTVTPAIKNIDDEQVVTKLSFNDLDHTITADNKEEVVEAPKTLERLEDISVSRAMERKMMEEEDDYDDDERIKIHTDTMDLTGFDVLDEPEKPVVESADIVLEAEELF